MEVEKNSKIVILLIPRKKGIINNEAEVPKT